MRLKKYIINEASVNKLDLDTAIDIVKKRCKVALEQYKKGNVIYRGVSRDTVGKDVHAMRSRDYKKIVKTVNNAFTVINENSSYWKGYPKRTKSLVCKTSLFEAKRYSLSYGIFPYVTFPYDGSKICVCPNDYYDFSFYRGLKMDLKPFTYSLEWLLFAYGFNKNNVKTYSKLEKSLSEIDKKIKKRFGKCDNLYGWRKYTENLAETIMAEWIVDYDPCVDNMMNHIKKLLSPKLNGFYMTKIGDNLPQEDEVWVDGEYILIDFDVIIRMENI